MTIQTFSAELIKTPDMDATYVIVPFDVEKTFGKKGHVKVKTTIDGVPYRGMIAKMEKNKPHLLIVTQAIRKQINKTPGETVKITIAVDTEERIVTIPEELEKLLTKNKKAKTFFDSLSFTNRKEYARWIETAKRLETKENRLKLTLEKLLAGKKNPTEK